MMIWNSSPHLSTHWEHLIPISRILEEDPGIGDPISDFHQTITPLSGFAEDDVVFRSSHGFLDQLHGRGK